MKLAASILFSVILIAFLYQLMHKTIISANRTDVITTLNTVTTYTGLQFPKSAKIIDGRFRPAKLVLVAKIQVQRSDLPYLLSQPYFQGVKETKYNDFADQEALIPELKERHWNVHGVTRFISGSASPARGGASWTLVDLTDETNPIIYIALID